LFDETAEFNDDGEPIAPPDAAAEKYATILENQQSPSFGIPASIQMNPDDFSVLEETIAARRSCSRLVAKQEAAQRATAAAAAEEEERQKRKEEARLQLIIETKNQLDQALKAAGQDYAGIKIIPRKYFSSESGAEFKIETDDTTFLLYLAKTLCAITKGSSTMMRNPNIINKKCAVAGFFARLGLLLRSIIAKIKKKGEDASDDDEDDDAGRVNVPAAMGMGKPAAMGMGKPAAMGIMGMGKPAAMGIMGMGKLGGFRQEGGRGESIFEPIGLRLAIEGIGAANQCFKGVGAIKDIPRIRCYICGELWLDGQKTMECEHIFCVGLAAQYFGLLRSTAFSEQQKLVLSILYAWAHRCCNQLKSNISFMKFKTPPAQGFEFNHDNAMELLNNIYGNPNYDCRSVNTSISKTFNTKKKFTDARIPVLGRYCRPLISEINAVRQTIFFDNTQLFAFMGILKIATTALVLFTGSDSVTGSLAIKSKDMIELLGLFNPDLKVGNVGASSASHKNLTSPNKKKAKQGEDKSSSPQSGGGLGEVKFPSSPEHLTSKYVQNLSLLLQWDIEHHRNHPRVVKIVPPQQWAYIPPVTAADAPAAETDDVTVSVQFVNKDTKEKLRVIVEIPVSVTSDSLSQILNILLKHAYQYNSFVNGDQITNDPDSFRQILGRHDLDSETVFDIEYCIVGSEGCDGGGEQARDQPHHHLGEEKHEDTQDEEDQDEEDQDEEELTVVVDKTGDPHPPPDYGEVYPPPSHAPAPAEHNLDKFVFNLLAHTHEMNTNTILQALVFDTDETRKNALKVAISTITTSFLDQEPLAITKRQASVLQLLILTNVNIGPFTALVQRTIDNLLTPDEIYNQVTQAGCITATKKGDTLSHEEITDVKRVCFALSTGQVHVPVSGDNSLFEKFLNEIHEDIFLFLPYCESPRLKSLVDKIERPSQWSSGKNLPVDRMFEFDRKTSISSPFVMKDNSVQSLNAANTESIKQHMHHLCEAVCRFFSNDSTDKPIEPTFNQAKDTLLDGLVPFVPDQQMVSSQEKKNILNENLCHNIHMCVDHIFTGMGYDNNNAVEMCMGNLVKPFLKAAFVVVTKHDEPLDVPPDSKSNMRVVESNQDPPQSPSNRSNDWVGGPHHPVSDTGSFPDSPVFSQHSKSEEQDMLEATQSFSPPRHSQPQFNLIDDVDILFFTLFLIADIQKDNSRIFNSNDSHIIRNICREWTEEFCKKNNPHLHNCQIIYIPHLVPPTDGGGRRNKSSIRTRRKLGRNHRRNQHTNKHKRSSSKTTRHTTIKHRKSYRKHNHTIKRRKNSRRRNQ